MNGSLKSAKSPAERKPTKIVIRNSKNRKSCQSRRGIVVMAWRVRATVWAAT